MRIFEHFPQNNKVCPVCKTRQDAETVLVPIPGTEEGNNMQAMCVHKKCFELVIYDETGEDHEKSNE